MNVVEILQNLQVLCNQFSEYHNDWVRLKNQNEFVFDVSHNSPIRDMYAEGGGCAYYLKGSLDTSYVNKSMLIDEYVSNVRKSIPPEQDYNSIGQAAQQDFEASYPENHTVRYMLRLYWGQYETIERVEQFLSMLIASSAYQPLIRSSPMQVIQQYVKHWEQNAQLHKGLDENALRSQLVLTLQRDGFQAGAETHAFQGHADIVVAKPSFDGVASNGHQLVAECKIWRGPSALYNALSQLCQYVTPNDSHAALIVFVNDGSFVDICSKSEQCLVEHPSCRVHSVISTDYVHYSLIPAQNQALEIPATLLLCNLTTPRY
ncbi:hypothetical protein ACFIOZ_03990 [Vreelandella sp. F11]|uniref:hypothetical protein n=1 Tax=Vreelandella sp. F11 TaxID=3394751 RepID=UPI0036D790CB